MSAGRLKILFPCTGNACRSQMAEGWAHALKSDRIDAYSAGIRAHGLDPRAVRLMAEAGVDIAAPRSKNLGELTGIHFDVVVTVCDNAREQCPRPPGGARHAQVPFDDPPALAREARSEDEALAHYRRVRDEIREFVEKLPEALE